MAARSNIIQLSAFLSGGPLVLDRRGVVIGGTGGSDGIGRVQARLVKQLTIAAERRCLDRAISTDAALEHSPPVQKSGAEEEITNGKSTTPPAPLELPRDGTRPRSLEL